MINKFFKTIHNKYLKFFRFIFFIRYLFAIFGISIALFLIIPTYFNYEKRAELIKKHLLNNYDFEIKNYEKIKFTALPLPRLEISNIQINLKSSDIKSTIKNLKIYPKFLSIYNYDKFQTNKIVLKNSNMILNTTDLRFFVNHIIKSKKNLALDNLNLVIKNDNMSIIKLENIEFYNYGYNKNLISGHIFGEKFETKIKKNFKGLNFKLLNSGINADIDFGKNKKKDLIIGTFQSKILNSKLKFNFDYDTKELNIFDSYFRSKNLSFNNKSSVILKPFFYSNSKFDIQEFNFKIIKNVDLKKILEAKSFIKKINSKNEINFKSKKFSRNLVNVLSLKIDTAYGRMNYVKKFSISDNYFECQGNVNLLDEYPLLFFDCSIISDDKKKLLKTFFIKTKTKNKVFKLKVSGNFNILNKKVNFKKINLNDSYLATKEDLKYFKETFENILFDENFIKIFNLKKIKRFILEVS